MERKLKILIADDQTTGQKIIEGFVLAYFKSENYIEINKIGIATKAIKLIENGDTYDFIFADLDFDTEIDKKKGYSGKDILIAAAKQYPSNIKTKLFTVSGEKGTSKIDSLEWELDEMGIEYESLLKDEPIKRVIQKIKISHISWSKSLLSVGIHPKDKNTFLSSMTSGNLSNTITVYDSESTMEYVLSYWKLNNIDVTTESILKEFPASLLDLPKIKPLKLFSPNGTNNRGLWKINSPLCDYYIEFWMNYSDHLTAIEKVAKDFLNILVSTYMTSEVYCDDTYSKNESQFTTLFTELGRAIQNEKAVPQGELKHPKEIGTMSSFMKRLWIRLFCFGGYFLGLSQIDLFRLIGKQNLVKQPGTSNFKIFHRSLWIDGLSESMKGYDRNYLGIWNSLCEYEKRVIREWWSDIKKIEGFENLVERRNLQSVVRILDDK